MDYDAIVIGSGAGGLTAAVALAQAGKKCWCSSSTIGQAAGRIPSRSMAIASAPACTTSATCTRAGICEIDEGLGVSQDLTFCELNPDGYDHIIVGDQRVDFPKGKANLIERLKGHFPQRSGRYRFRSRHADEPDRIAVPRQRLESSAARCAERADHFEVAARHWRGPHQRAY